MLKYGANGQKNETAVVAQQWGLALQREASGTRSTRTLNHTTSTCPSQRYINNSTKHPASNRSGAEQFVRSKPERTHLQNIFKGQ
jgi:hypothetical protein